MITLDLPIAVVCARCRRTEETAWYLADLRCHHESRRPLTPLCEECRDACGEIATCEHCGVVTWRDCGTHDPVEDVWVCERCWPDHWDAVRHSYPSEAAMDGDYARHDDHLVGWTRRDS